MAGEVPSANPSWLARNAKLILGILTLASWSVTVVIALQKGETPPPMPPVFTVVDNDENGGPPNRFAQGWIRDDDEVTRVVSTLAHPVFAATPAGSVDVIPDHFYLWDVASSVGVTILPRDQGSVGSCVSFGAACAVEYSQCSAMADAKANHHRMPSFKPVSQEVIYGGSRVQVGGGRIRGDGSVGAWAAKWCREWGSVARGKYGNIDLEAYSESVCRQYGSRGCPKELEPEAKLHPTRAISPIKTVDEAKRALAAGCPVTVASDVGFGNRGPYVRNSLGQLKASGTWAHQMCLIGYDKTSGFLCQNSWGAKWVSGPKGPGNPPDGSFYIEDRTVQRMLDQGDSFAFGDQVGFPARRPNWFVSEPKNDLPRGRFTPGEAFALAW